MLQNNSKSNLPVEEVTTVLEVMLVMVALEEVEPVTMTQEVEEIVVVKSLCQPINNMDSKV